MLNQADLYCFSPTGGTRKTASILAQAMAQRVSVYDLGSRKPLEDLAEADVAVIAVPVFGGHE